jgi:hypothetical protein
MEKQRILYLMPETDQKDAELAAFEAEFRERVRKRFAIEEMLEVAAEGLHCELIKTHVTQHQLVESTPYPDWSCRLAWWKAIAQAGGMIAPIADEKTSDSTIWALLAEARKRVPE